MPQALPRKMNWRALHELGSGGQGTVWKATREDPQAALSEVLGALRNAARLDEWERAQQLNVAKRLADACSLHARHDAPENLGAMQVFKPWRGDDAEKARARFRRELQVLSTVKHPHLVAYLDGDGESDWFVTEYLEGGSLDRALERFKGDALASLQLLRSIAGAVSALHDAGIVHRDIKPANVLLRRDGAPVLGDLGIAFFRSDDHTRLTSEFETVGTTHFIPEWAAGHRIDDVRPSFDVYSLGKLLWSLVAGERRMPGVHWSAKDVRNLTRRFPDQPEMAAVNAVLERTVVNEEGDCLPHVRELVKVLDGAIREVQGTSRVFAGEYKSTCMACGASHYELMTPEHSDGMLGLYGWSGAGAHRLKACECPHCGHAAFFGTALPRGDVRPAWRRT